MDTKRSIEVKVEGVSLTPEEKEELNKKLSEYLNDEEKLKEKKERFKIFDSMKEKINDFRWNMGVKWDMLDTNKKLMIVTTSAVIATMISKEIRLQKRERRLQHERH